MTTSRPGLGFWVVSLFAFAFTLAPASATAQVPASVQMVVTVLPTKGTVLPRVTAADIAVREGKAHVAVTGWQSLQGPAGAVQLYLAVDDDTANLGPRLNDLRHFIANLPASVSVAIGYMRNGSVDQLQPFTSDHALAAQRLRLPAAMSGISPSPYDSVQEILKKWPAPSGPGFTRRVLFLLSDGVEHFDGNNPDNPIFQAAIAQAQRAEVSVSTIYMRGADDPRGLIQWETDRGLGNLALLSESTGGDALSAATTTPFDLTPYFDEIQNRLQHQYLLSFTPVAGKSGFQKVSVTLELPHARLTAPPGVFVP